MILYRLKLRPRSPWRTPWQADTLTGMLLATCARTHGSNVLRDRLIEPMLDGSPPFILSDACPGNLMPVPLWLRLAEWPEDVDRKQLKRVRWLSADAFKDARAGTRPSFDQFAADEQFFLDHVHQHNTLSRLSDTTGEAESGFAPFTRPETLLLCTDPSEDQHAGFLSVYFRILDPTGDAGNLLLDLMHELALTGFGADTATGRGQFDIIDDPQPVPEFDAPLENANAVICLSTFQPGTNDPTDGLWEAFPKFGKLGPDLNVADVRKNPLIMFRPGACFRTDAAPPFLGRAVPMQELLPEQTANELQQRDMNIIHPAFGLCIPANITHDFAI